MSQASSEAWFNSDDHFEKRIDNDDIARSPDANPKPARNALSTAMLPPPPPPPQNPVIVETKTLSDQPRFEYTDEDKQYIIGKFICSS